MSLEQPTQKDTLGYIGWGRLRRVDAAIRIVQVDNRPVTGDSVSLFLSNEEATHHRIRFMVGAVRSVSGRLPVAKRRATGRRASDTRTDVNRRAAAGHNGGGSLYTDLDPLRHGNASACQHRDSNHRGHPAAIGHR